MSELDEFLSWGTNITKSDKKDSFWRPFREKRFPYGELSYWITEFKKDKGIK